MLNTSWRSAAATSLLLCLAFAPSCLFISGCGRKKCSTNADCKEGAVCIDGRCTSISLRTGPVTPGQPGRRKSPDPSAVYRVDVDPAKHPILGPKDALVTVIEISEFQCPYCTRGAKTIKEVVAGYPQDVRLVFMHNPLPFHKDAFGAAEASMAVFTQKGSEGFYKYHDILFENRKNLKRPDLERYVQSLGVDTKKFAEALDKGVHKAEIRKQMAMARRLGASGTPAWFINGRFLSGARPADAFKKLIDEELAKAKKLVAEKKISRDKVYEHIMKTAKTKVE